MEDPLSVVEALNGARVDDACSGMADISVGGVCAHVTLTNGGSRLEKEVTIAGTAGTVYDVTLRVRGIVEPANIQGGMREDTSTFQYMNAPYRKVPFTVGGTVVAADADYTQWSIDVAEPEQTYYLNDYQKVGHQIFKLDYEVTIPMAANTTVTLTGYDENERMITNYEQYEFDDIPGSMNYGQFVQLDIVSVAPQTGN